MRSSTRNARLRAKRLLAVPALIALLAPMLMMPAAFAAPVLTVTPITWNVIGLDSNDVTDGPNVFPVGVRVCNTGDTAATNLQATFVWDTANALVNIAGASSLTSPQLAAGDCTDFNFEVVITRNSAAYDTVRGFHINVTADGLGIVSTPTPREVYVEHLVSQARNDITSITGPTTVYVGQTYTYTLVASTATNGYEQLETFLTFPNIVFRVDAVTSSYSAPVGGTNDKVYADACGWDNLPTSATYRECIGPENYVGAKAGGDITTTFTVTILSAGSANLTALIYDFSGSSYHYNGDYGVDVLSVTALNSADLSMTKTDTADPVPAGDDVIYELSVANAGPNDASSLTVTDTLPAGTTFVSASGIGWTCVHASGTVTCTRPALAAGATAPDISVRVTAPSAGGSITNTASVSSSTNDPTGGNDSDSEQTTITPSADLEVSTSDTPDPVTTGADVDYTLTVTNHGVSDATGVTVTDTLPAGTTFVSATGTGWTCNEAAGTVTCTRPALAAGASAPDITITVTAPGIVGTITNTATVAANETDSVPGNNSDAEDTDVQAPPANSPPVADDDTATTPEGTAVLIDVTANDTDVDGNLDPSTVNVTAGPTDGTVACDAAGVCTYTPDPLFTGTDSFVYEVCDTDGECDTASVTITVTPPPSADLQLGQSDAPDPVDEGTDVDYTLTVTNNGPSDATNVTVTDTLPAGTTFVSASGTGWTCNELAGTATCTRPALQSGATAPDITIVVTAPTGPTTITNAASVGATENDPVPANNSDSEDTDVVVPPPPNNPPVATDDSATTAEDTDVAIGVSANDSDIDGNLDPSTVNVTTGPTDGTVTCDASGVCTYDPDPGFTSADGFDYEICDTDGACDTASVSITVTAAPPPPNNPPVATDDSATTTAGTAVPIGVSANDTDIDGNLDPSTVQVTSGPVSGTVSCDALGVCTYTPNPGFSGPDAFDYQICDTNGACDTATVSITVNALPPPPPVNNPPVAGDDTATTAAGAQVAIGVSANDSDVDGNLDPSTVQVTSGPANGTVSCAPSGVCTYTPTTGFSGTDSFTYEICDTDGACDTASVTITVTAPPPPPNDPPVAVDDSATTTAGTGVAIGLSANDSDPDGNLDPSTVQVTSGPSNGTVTCAASGVCTYTPNPGFSGTDTFDYEICDADGECDTGRVTITVTAPAQAPAPTPAPNPAPVPPPPPSLDAIDDSAQTVLHTAVVIVVVTNDEVPDRDQLRLTENTDARDGSVTCTRAGVCTYSPGAVTGTDIFNYTICIDGNRCDTARVRIDVTGPGTEAGVATAQVIQGTLPFTGKPIASLLLVIGFLTATGISLLMLARGRMESQAVPVEARPSSGAWTFSFSDSGPSRRRRS